MNFEPITKYLTPVSVLDVGANSAHWTKDARKHWPNAYYLLLEANPECAPALDASGESFRIVALSDSEKDVTFYTRKGSPACTGASYMREITTPFYEGDNAVPVTLRTQRLDDVLDGTYFELLKLDTQGSERDILKGAPDTIANAKAVVLEVALEQYNEGAPSAEEMIQFMGSHGFHLAEVLSNIPHPIGRHTIQQDLLFVR